MTSADSTSAISRKPVWLITGCSTGFGRELAKHVIERGYRTVVTARNPDEVKDLAAKGEALALKLDVTDQGQIDAAIKAAEEKFGRIDVLVNNAGIGYFAAVEESEEDQIRRMFEINVFGLSRMIHAVLPGMRKRRKGFIVNLSSIGRTAFIPVRRLLQRNKICGRRLVRSALAGGRTAGHQGDARRTERVPHRLGWAFGERKQAANRRLRRDGGRMARSSARQLPASKRATRCLPRMPSSRRCCPRTRRTACFLATMLTKQPLRSSKNCATSSLRGKRFLAGPISRRNSGEGGLSRS